MNHNKLKNKILLSLVITTFNREENVIKIIKNLQKQILVDCSKIEIIICDSNSSYKYKILNFIKTFSNFNIFYYNSKINHQSIKRNLGIKKSLSNKVILIDDDCFPQRDFFFNFLKVLRLQRKKEIYCGQVKHVSFPNNINLTKYRDSRFLDYSKYQNIEPKNFISMNMALNKNNILPTNFFFNKNFRFYGFEDYEFAYRLSGIGYYIFQTNALILHKDNRGFKDFLNKFGYLAAFSIPELIKINKKISNDLVYTKIENFFIFKFLSKLPGLMIILNCLKIVLIYLEKKLPFYLSFVYRFGILISYMSGFIERKNHSKKLSIFNIKDWYK